MLPELPLAWSMASHLRGPGKGTLYSASREDSPSLCLETPLSSPHSVSAQAIAISYSSEVTLDIFSTSCSYKPKEYNPEHEVFVTRDPSYQESRICDVGTKKKNTEGHKPQIPIKYLFFPSRGQNEHGATFQK